MTRVTIKVHNSTNWEETDRGNAVWQRKIDDLGPQKWFRVFEKVHWNRARSTPRANVDDHDKKGENACKFDEFQNKHKNAAKSTRLSQSAHKTGIENAK
jgi:hypothetical protein